MFVDLYTFHDPGWLGLAQSVRFQYDAMDNDRNGDAPLPAGEKKKKSKTNNTKRK